VSGSDTVRSKKGMRHTIQVEYSSDPVPEIADLSISQSLSRTQENNDPFLSVNTGGAPGPLQQMIEISESMPSTPLDTTMNVDKRSPANSPIVDRDATPRKQTPVISISPSTPAKLAKEPGVVSPTSASKEVGTFLNGGSTPTASQAPSSWTKSAEGLAEKAQVVSVSQKSTAEEVNGTRPQEASSPTASAAASVGSSSSKSKGRHIRGLSIDKLPFRRPGSSSGKDMLNVNHQSRRQVASESAPTSTYTNSMISTATPSAYSAASSEVGASGEEEKDTAKSKEGKSSRRKTLSFMMDPIKNRLVIILVRICID
jgi:hypothetical protein